jgi:hypothetical protein
MRQLIYWSLIFLLIFMQPYAFNVTNNLIFSLWVIIVFAANYWFGRSSE